MMGLIHLSDGTTSFGDQTVLVHATFLKSARAYAYHCPLVHDWDVSARDSANTLAQLMEVEPDLVMPALRDTSMQSVKSVLASTLGIISAAANRKSDKVDGNDRLT